MMSLENKFLLIKKKDMIYLNNAQLFNLYVYLFKFIKKEQL